MPQRIGSRKVARACMVGSATPTGCAPGGPGMRLPLNSLAAGRKGLAEVSEHRCDRANFPQRNSMILSVSVWFLARNDKQALANRVTQQGGHC